MARETTTVRTEAPDGGRRRPTLPGFDRDDDEWRLGLDRYETLVHDVTGVDVSGGLSPDEIKVVQTRLEGYVEACKHDDDTRCDVDRYEHVDSLATVRELARFFRVLVANRVERAPADR